MGEVYVIEDVRVRRQVAAKFIRMEMIQSDQQSTSNALRLFWREATAIAQLDHPAILPLYDHGEEIIDDAHVAYLVMPYRPEGSLTAWLRKRAQTRQTPPLTLKQIAHLIQQAGQSLQYAHDHQVMHLDVKPANFLIQSKSATDDYPHLLLCDFGIARLASATSNASQHVRGTPLYMAPEQWANQPGFASDQYALAIMAYELLTGSPPFQGAPLNVMFAHLQEQPPSARERNPLLPSAVDLVLQRALAKKPEERFPSITEFAQVLQEALQEVRKESTFPAPTTLDASSAYAPAANNGAASSSNMQLAQSLPPMSVVVPVQEKVTLSSSVSAEAARVTAPRSLIMSTQPASASPSSATRSPSVSVRPTKRRSPLLVGALLLLILVFIAGGSFSIWRVATATTQANGKATATTQANPGRTWHVQTSNTDAPLQDVAWSGSQFVAVGHDTILTSSDGHTWIAQNSGTSQEDLNDVAWLDSQFIAVGWNGQGSMILTSPDGRTWTTQYLGPPTNLLGVAWSGSQFVVVGGAGDSGTILTSPDGHTWTTQSFDLRQNIWGVAWSGSQFVAVGTSGTLLTSPNGHTWIAQNSGTSQDLQGVAWLDSQFIAVGKFGTILTSPDGHTWTVQNSETPRDLTSVAWSGSQFVAVGWSGTMGESGTILTSSNGHTWIAQNSGPLTSVVWSGSQFVAVGDLGLIFTSP
ncbi:hypothetical protein KSC_023470 [Ktedonobacter sp. SOSP1-52]|nr:hypothetical protein KSC_023470 [Ktedonobacter sp. SOSP1-52]